MTSGEQIPDQDPRLANPDQYFGDRYGDVVITYGKYVGPLGVALKFEHTMRSPEKIANDPKEQRANMMIGMLREAGALDPEDDITYEEHS